MLPNKYTNRIIWFLFIPVLVMSLSCNKQNEDSIEFSKLNGNTYTLKVNRKAILPQVIFPNDSLLESHYIPIVERFGYEVTFSQSGEFITIMPGNVRGIRIYIGEKSIRYDLNEGLIAGGRFITWISNNEFEAEYTVYGSGIPIITSERGVLSK